MKLRPHDIRDGESARAYIRRISFLRQAMLLVIGLAIFTAAIGYIALVFETMRQIAEQLPLWLNLYLATGFVFLCFVAAVVMELRDRRRR